MPPSLQTNQSREPQSQTNLKPLIDLFALLLEWEMEDRNNHKNKDRLTEEGENEM